MSKPQPKSNLDIAMAKAAANYAQGFSGKVAVTGTGKTGQLLSPIKAKAVKS